MLEGFKMYQQSTMHDAPNVDPLVLAYVGIYQREVPFQSIPQVLGLKIKSALGLLGTTLDNPITGQTRYWYQTIGSLAYQHGWDIERIHGWLQGQGL